MIDSSLDHGYNFLSPKIFQDLSRKIGDSDEINIREEHVEHVVMPKSLANNHLLIHVSMYSNSRAKANDRGHDGLVL